MSDIDEYLSWDAVAMGEQVRIGHVSAAELEAICRTLIDRLGPRLGCIADVADYAIVVDPAEAAGVFAGVPFAVKELLAVPGLPWTMGSRLMAEYPVSDASPYVQRLLAAGLRVICSTTSSEFGLLGSTETALRGTTSNPWRPGISAGGSSGGSAAAVAAGIVPIAHANDGGGSIRYPAAMTGLFGFKPSNGRCEPTGPEAGGLMSLVVEHCVSRSVRDSAAMLAATERRDPEAPMPPIGRIEKAGRRRLRIGRLTTSLTGDQPFAEVRSALDRSAALLDSLGHHLVDLDPVAVDGRALPDAFFTTAALTMVSMADMVSPLLGRSPGPDELEPFTLELIEWGRSLPADAERTTARTIIDSAAAYRAAFAQCDVVLSPTLTRPPWELGTLDPTLGRATLVRRTEQLVGYTPIHNVAGCPAMSVPLEQHDGLPIGIHFAADVGADAMLLELAFELEAARPWADRRPDLSAFGLETAWPRS